MTTQKAFLECKGVWKVFGPGAEDFATNPGGEASTEEFSAHGLIAGVRDASLSVAKGEIFIIMGLSGSGKSTLVRCMTGLHELTAGHVLIDGIDINNISEKELVKLRRKKISMVFQDFALLPHLTVLGNIAFPLKVQGVPRAEREATARKMIELVGLSGRESYYPDELSGGQQQRVGIARSLTTQPEVWFLDEPFSALDPLIRQEMQSEFLRLQAMLHKTIVFITHDFDEAIRLADRMAVMKDGEIVQMGTPEEFILNPANDYIREFTKHIPKDKVLKVGSIANGSDAPTNDQPLQASASLQSVAEQVIAGDGRHPVIDAAGQVIGSLHRSELGPYLL
ncbi:quaternary amine ABC transporter ATP-binding protein [Defluviimonas salinarum]|uniref:Quaternary amine transport ATP-binding protein n=1 Tax=Defluviimonas salinarum TaxID=2992147 RepID=A0ABT3J7E8_9RHOB|nr:betaine/proline/choline family ABC transporter ATP-binding protein [Defluviimonas salinarum]MCW3783621.1 betaine/proline/choline family ABC transporter ATP-binding protein [Defluviimonas salinarum]